MRWLLWLVVLMVVLAACGGEAAQVLVLDGLAALGVLAVGED